MLPNLCAAAHKCAARAVEVCHSRMAEIKSFQSRLGFSIRVNVVIRTIFPPQKHVFRGGTFRHGSSTLLLTADTQLLLTKHMANGQLMPQQ